MSAATQPAHSSNKMLWAGRILSGILVALLIMSGVMKLMMPPESEKDLDHIGWKMSVIGGIAALELGSVVLYAIPQTSMLGAILLTGYLGGACATHVRIGEYGMSLAPVALGVLVWVGLFLRDARVRALIPLRTL